MAPNYIWQIQFNSIQYERASHSFSQLFEPQPSQQTIGLPWSWSSPVGYNENSFIDSPVKWWKPLKSFGHSELGLGCKSANKWRRWRCCMASPLSLSLSLSLSLAGSPQLQLRVRTLRLHNIHHKALERLGLGQIWS